MSSACYSHHNSPAASRPASLYSSGGSPVPPSSLCSLSPTPVVGQQLHQPQPPQHHHQVQTFQVCGSPTDSAAGTSLMYYQGPGQQHSPGQYFSQFNQSYHLHNNQLDGFGNHHSGGSSSSAAPSGGSSTISTSESMSMSINLEQYISKRNERERSRVRNVNEAFDHLKNSLPLETEKMSKRMSKVEILRTAISYIRNLEKILDHQQQQPPTQQQQSREHTTQQQLSRSFAQLVVPAGLQNVCPNLEQSLHFEEQRTPSAQHSLQMRQRVGSDSRMLVARHHHNVAVNRQQQQQHQLHRLDGGKHMGLALERQLVHPNAGLRHEQTRWASAEGQGQLVDLNNNQICRNNFSSALIDGPASNYDIQEFTTTTTTKREIHDLQQQRQPQQWAMVSYNQY